MRGSGFGSELLVDGEERQDEMEVTGVQRCSMEEKEEEKKKRHCCCIQKVAQLFF